MRVCHVLETSGGGSGKVVLDLVETGLAAGYAITVVFAPDRAEPGFVEALRGFGSRIKVRPLAMKRAVGLHDLSSFAKLVALLLKEGPFDVVHSHSSKAGGLARLARFAAPRAVQIYSPHAFVTMDPKASGLYRLMEKALARLADGIVCVSEAERTHARQELCIPEEKLFVVPNGTRVSAESERAEARARLGVGPEATLIGFVGRFVEQKEPLRVVGAFAAQASRAPEAVLAMLGAGPLESHVQAFCAERNLDQRVRKIEGASASYLPGFDVLLCGSAYEALSLVFLEALAAGVPIVTTPVGGASECVVPGETGFVAQAMTESALAEALGQYLALSAEAKAHMAEAARERSKKFTLSAQAEAMREVYGACQGARRERTAWA